MEADPEQAARLQFVVGDIADAAAVAPLVADADAVVNFAAESHVDRSILDPEAFLRTDVMGVHVLLEACRVEQERAARGERAGRAEVPPGLHGRGLRIGRDRRRAARTIGSSRARPTPRPRPPASCSCHSYFVTYGLDVVVTRGSNTYGPYHHPEKLIPLFITNAIDDQQLPLYGDGLQRRDWLYVADHAGAIGHVLEHGVSGETYNIPGNNERTNRDVVAALLESARQAVVAGPAGRGSAGPRPPLRHGRLQARRPGLDEQDELRGRSGRDGGLVSREPGLVALHQVRRVGRLLPPPVRRSTGRLASKPRE